MCVNCEEKQRVLAYNDFQVLDTESFNTVEPEGILLDEESGDMIEMDPTPMPGDTNPVSTLPQTMPSGGDVPTLEKADTAYAEFNFGTGKSPEEIAAQTQFQKYVFWGIAAVVVLILILVGAKMLKSKK